MHASRPARAFGLGFGLFVLVWSAITLAFAAQLAFSAGWPWTAALRSSLADWLPWLALTPLVAWLARRFPLERGRLVRSVPIHLAGCVLAIVLCGWVGEKMIIRIVAPLPVMRGGMGSPVDGPRRFAPEGPPPENAGRPFPFPPDRPPGGPGRWRRPLERLIWARTKLDFPVYWVIVSVAHALAFYRRLEERERKALELTASLSQAKLEALRLQLQPHFLFNTLNAIATLVHRDAAAADEMITNLSELLRLSLDASETEVPLRRELDLVDRYLAIEHVRLGERLRVNRSIALDVLDVAVPPLMLQTIVENAVRHGIEPRRAAGTVTICAARRDAKLELSVADDGIGLPPADERSERRGVGLANTEARLRELHGDAARVILRAPPEGGTRVEIELPWRRISPVSAAKNP